jgi:uncharacterized OB-fold protein
MSATPKPLPVPTPETEPFWKAARDHRLSLPKCTDCARIRFPPSGHCPACGSPAHEWVDLSGAGKVFSFVTYQRLYNKGWENELPYVVAVIELAEGPRILSTLTGIEPEDVVCDMAVKVVFDDVTQDVTMPQFTPA